MFRGWNHLACVLLTCHLMVFNDPDEPNRRLMFGVAAGVAESRQKVRELRFCRDLFHNFVRNVEVGSNTLDVIIIFKGIDQLEDFGGVICVEFDGI